MKTNRDTKPSLWPQIDLRSTLKVAIFNLILTEKYPEVVKEIVEDTDTYLSKFSSDEEISAMQELIYNSSDPINRKITVKDVLDRMLEEKRKSK